MMKHFKMMEQRIYVLEKLQDVLALEHNLDAGTSSSHNIYEISLKSLDKLRTLFDEIEKIRDLRDMALQRTKDRTFKLLLTRSVSREDSAMERVASYIQKLKASGSEDGPSTNPKMTEWAGQFRDAVKIGSVEDLQVCPCFMVHMRLT
jgi:hypothetical protein